MMKFIFGTVAAGVLALALPVFAQPASRTKQTASSTHNGSPTQIAHGKYVVTRVAGCADCHTPMDNKGQPLPGKWLKGSKLSFGPLVPFPAWATTAPDIAGLPGWSTQDAVHLLMTGQGPDGHRPRPPMPQYRMNHADATAVVAYLDSVGRRGSK
ncbi:MAG: c-type cytochrome [Acidobacteriaceae bacterium]